MSLRRTFVTFESDYPLDESVARLSAATRSPMLASTGPQAAVGTVKAGRVKLMRVIPYVRNDFKPFFSGAFEETDGQVVLRGSFGMHVLAKGIIWFSGLFLLISAVALLVKSDVKDAWIGVVGVLVMAALTAGLVALGRWFARNDEAWLSNVIQRALRRESR